MSTATEIKPGLYPGMSRAEYEGIDAVNQSRLKPFLRSAAHGRYAMLHPGEPSDAMSLGTALHMAVLEPQRFILEYVVAPKCDRRTKAGKEEWAAFEIANGSKTLLCPDEMEACKAMSESLYRHPLAGPVLCAGGHSESAIVWRDAETGLACKGLVDRITRFSGMNLVLDIKSTRNAAPPHEDEDSCLFASDAASMGYAFQAAFYFDGLNAISRAERVFWILAVENEPPYCAAVYEVTDEAMEYGRAQYRRALDLYARSRERESWPGYDTSKHLLNLPSWTRKRSAE